jgi:TetR/AcrR family transcriptional repressor of nem operon
MSPGPDKRFDRDEVLEKAMNVFWERGYEATGISQLLERTGIGRQSLYDTFGDKRSLFIETLNHYFRTRVGPLLAQLRAPGSPRENLLQAFRMAEKTISQADFHGCMIGNTTAELTERDPEVKVLVKGYLDAMEDAFTELLRRGQKAGEFPDDIDPRDLARVFVHTLQGLTLLHKVLRDPGTARVVLGSTLKLLRVE